MMRSLLLLLLVSFATVSATYANSDPVADSQMARAKFMVEMMKLASPPDAIRETLLTEARPEDLAFVKSMLVH